MSTQDLINETVGLTMHTYKAQPVALERGEGCYAFDTDGKKYLDFANGYAVTALGHAHEGMLDVINTQARKLMICQASYMTEARRDAAKNLIDHSVFDKVFFTNSGTESIECALKIARKWAYDNKSEGAHEIIAFHNGFHGRSYGASSVTYKAAQQPFFAPYVPGVHFAHLNNLESVKALVSEKTAAIIVEPVQGEGGLYVAEPAFLQGLREICDREQIALIYDEVQCGMGRMGTYFAYESFVCCPDCVDGGDVVAGNAAPVAPDIVCLAKGIGGGFPVGACLATDKFASAFVPGTHGSTYGGNPLACAVVAYVTGEIMKPSFLAHVNEMAAHLKAGLEDIAARSNKVQGVAGMGLMLGLETSLPPGDVINKCLERGLMVTQAGTDKVRMTPPLIAEKSHIDEGLEILGKVLTEDF